MEKGKVTMFVIVIAFIILIASIYFTIFFHYRCDNLACFKSHQMKCVRTKFVYDTDSTTWFYRIKEKEGGKCIIEVTINQIKEGRLDRQILEGKSMDCYLNLGSIELPESDLTMCHGRLKEDIQEIMIKNTHSQIVNNLENELKGII